MRQILHKTLRLRAWMMMAMLIAAVTGAWADVSTLTFTAACGGSGTADDNVAWTVTSDGKESTFDNDRGIHYGTNKAAVKYIELTTSGISGTITKVVVNASTASDVTATAGVTVGGVAFGGDAQSLTTSATEYTFEGSASGEIIVTVTKPSQAAKAIYVKSVEVTYTTSGGETPTPTEKQACDLALTGAPISLSFDLYNNSTAQVIHYTTSSTGEVSVEAGQYDVSCSVDATGKTITVTPIAVTNGEQTVTVNQAADDNYEAGSVTFTVTVTDSTPADNPDPQPQDGEGTWVTTNIADLTSADVFVIVGNNGSDYALSNNNGTSSAPAAVAVTVADGKLTGEITDNIKWNISGNATDGYTFYPAGKTETWLYCISNNNGIRVGNNSAKTFSISEEGYLKNNSTSRYLGIYNSDHWRCYTSINSNIEEQTFTFYKYEDTSGPSDTRSATTTTIDATGITNTNVFEDTAAGRLTATVAAGETTIDNAAITWSGNDDAVATIAADGTVTLVDEGEVTFTATYAGDETNYKGSSATYKLTVINNDPNAPGTLNKPYTVADAIEAIEAGTGITDVYATGIVSAIVTAYNSQYGNITYNISADGSTDGNQLQAYRGKSYNGDNFTSADDIQVGDKVVIFGTLKKYNTTYEFDQNNQLVSLVRKLAAPTFSVEAGEYDSAQSVELSAADGATIYYTTDGTEPTAQSTAYTEAIIVSETMTIKAIAVKDNEASDVATATYTISTLPSIDVAKTAISASYSQKQGTLEVTWNNIKQPAAAVKFYEADGTTETTYDWITAEINNSNNVDYAIEANTGDARTAYLKVFDSNSSVSSDLITITQAKYVKDFAALPFSFLDKGKDKIPTGLKQNGLGSDYKSSPYLKFDTTGDNLILKINERPGVLSFDIKGYDFSGGTFTVQTSEDGETYTDLEAFNKLSGDKQNMNFDNLGENVRYIKWVYTTKSSGNVALGNIMLAEYVEPVPTITPESTAIALEATDGEGSISVTYTNFEASDVKIQFLAADGTTPATYDWLTAELDDTRSINYTYEANTGDERTAYIKISAHDTDANAVYSDLITITQAGKPKADVTLAFSKESVTVIGIAEVEEPTLTATSGEAAVEGLAITYSSSDTDVATVDETTGAVTIVAYGTAIITAYFAGNDNYNAATATYTIMVDNPDKTYYALVAAYNGKHYAMNAEGGSTWGATEVNAVNGKVVNGKCDELSWEIISYGNGVGLRNKSSKEYIGQGSSTNLAANKTLQQWDIDAENNSYVQNNRSFIYRATAKGFKNYATSNIGSDDYAGYTQAYTFADGYVRDVTAGNWGTFCADHTIAAEDYSGVTFYSIAGKIVNAEGAPTNIVLTEVAGELTAGVAYIFQANEEANKLVAAYSEASADAPIATNGLVGSFTRTDVAEGMYLLSGGKVVKCGTGCNIAANRAYIDMSQVPVVDTSAAGVKLGIGDITVGIDGIQSNGTTGSIYNIAGQRMSKLQRGLNIVDGKKILVK